jgi:pilus assembly protein CpaB
VIAIGAFLFFRSFFGGAEPPKEKVVVVEKPVVQVQEVPTVDILVARQVIPVGTKIKPEMIDRQPWPSHLVLPGFVVSDGKQDSDISGLVARAPFQAREPVIRTKLANPNDPSFLAAALPEGKRAITVSVDALSGVAGFIFPGDHVDMMINQQVSLGPIDPANPGGAKLTEQIVEVLVPNVKVIAIDQAAAVDAAQGIRVPSTLTLEVTRAQAQKIKLGEQRGKLVMALRPFEKEEDDAELPRPTTQADLSRTVPPSYFPVLYESEVQYPTAIINPFATSGKEVTEIWGRSSNPTMAKDIEQRLKSGGVAGAVQGASEMMGALTGPAVVAPVKPTNAPAQAEGRQQEQATSGSTVKIYRGVSIEEKEVSTP